MRESMMSLLPVYCILKRLNRADHYFFRFLKIRQHAGIFFFITIGFIAFPKCAAGAYLPAVGPAPLRFELKSAGSVSFAPKWFLQNTSPANDAALPSPVSIATNATAVAPLSQPIATNANNSTIVTAPASTETNMNIPADEPPVSSPSYGSTVVNPQMLTEFFKSAPVGTNQTGTAVFVPAEVGFTPPSVQAGESRAIYKSQ